MKNSRCIFKFLLATAVLATTASPLACKRQHQESPVPALTAVPSKAPTPVPVQLGDAPRLPAEPPK
jgi:hypothetical protein